MTNLRVTAGDVCFQPLTVPDECTALIHADDNGGSDACWADNMTLC